MNVQQGNPILAEIFRTGCVEKPNGEKLPVKANIPQQYSEALYQTTLKVRPKLVIEIGMAYGISTLSILTALRELGGGKLISIDPYSNWDTGQAVALHQISKAGLSSFHQHIRQPSQIALAELWKESVCADLIYIDGYHNFEYALTDFFFCDKLLAPKGIVGFNDCGWRAVHKVIKFLQRHRRYEELPVLPKTYRSRNPVYSLIKRLEGRCSCDRYFVKKEDWEPPSGFFRNF